MQQQLSYKLLFWNILCDEYSFDWKTAPNIELKYKVWEHRSKLFKQIFSSKSTQSDLYCFVEVDKQDEIVAMINSNFDTKLFDFSYFPRVNTPLGIMLVYNKFKFKLLDSKKYLLNGSIYYNFAHCAILQETIFPYNIFGVLTTHLTAWDKNENIRIEQVNTMFEQLKSDENIKRFKVNKFIICGDYNTNPSSECIEIMKKNGYHSAFEINEENDNYTIVIDTMDEGLKKLKFDYIFGNENISFNNSKLPKECLDFERGIPNENFPSDHIYLQTEVTFR